MRGQDSGALAGLQRGDLGGEGKQPIGIDHERGGHARGHVAHELLGLGLAAEAGTERDHVALAREREDRPERRRREAALGRVGHRRRHRLGALQLQDLVDAGGTRDRDEPGARARRALRGERRGARLAARARYDQNVAEAALVTGRGTLGQVASGGARAPELRGRSGTRRLVGDPDARDDDAPRQAAARLEREPELREAERHGDVGRHRAAVYRSRVGVEARGQVDRHHPRGRTRPRGAGSPPLRRP
jgi:hypothetical protein